jgi:hypothetical protein
MRIGKIILHFITVFIITFSITAITTALYGRIVHGSCGLNIENAIIFGLIFGVVFTWSEKRRIERDEDEDDNPYD